MDKIGRFPRGKRGLKYIIRRQVTPWGRSLSWREAWIEMM